jgi:hypothetical protein
MKNLCSKYVILRRELYKAKIEKKITDTELWVVSYYDAKNKHTTRIIGQDEVIEEDEYNKIKERHNKINKLLE